MLDYYVCEEPGAGPFARSRQEWLRCGSPPPLWAGPARSRTDALQQYRRGERGGTRAGAAAPVLACS